MPGRATTCRSHFEALLACGVAGVPSMPSTPTMRLVITTLLLSLGAVVVALRAMRPTKT